MLAIGIGLASLRYLSGDAALVPPSMQVSFMLNGPIFITHATASAVALMLGVYQLFAGPRRRWPGVHRWTGRIYVVCCIVGGLSALWIAPDIESGHVATIGFSALGIAWMAATVLAWRHAVNRRFDSHRRWMLRSYGLTAAAISLRLQLVAFEGLGLDYDQVSNILSLSCWLPNVVFVEVLLARQNRSKARVTQIAPRPA
ncbi:MAG: DUF2306 domain-containing protein [Pseudomonadota bacterium]